MFWNFCKSVCLYFPCVQLWLVVMTYDISDLINYTTVLSQANNSLFRYASHSNLPSTSSELSSVTLRVGPASGSKVKAGRLPPVSVVSMLTASGASYLQSCCHSTTLLRHGGMVVRDNICRNKWWSVLDWTSWNSARRLILFIACMLLSWCVYSSFSALMLLVLVGKQ